VQKRLNLTICGFDCGLEWAEGCTSSIVFARWRQCARMEGHVAVTCRITLNHPSTAAMRLMANYFDHLLSLDTPTYTVEQIAKRFEPSTVLWAFHTIQPSSISIPINDYTPIGPSHGLYLIAQAYHKFISHKNVHSQN